VKKKSKQGWGIRVNAPNAWKMAQQNENLQNGERIPIR